MWVRCVLVALIALLVGALLGGRLFPTARYGTPAITALPARDDGDQAQRFVVANPRTGRATVYLVTGSDVVQIGSARY